jgi:hypothetical protein
LQEFVEWFHGDTASSNCQSKVFIHNGSAIHDDTPVIGQGQPRTFKRTSSWADDHMAFRVELASVAGTFELGWHAASPNVLHRATEVRAGCIDGKKKCAA